ncbi:MAG: hypothetical protein HY711_10610 [Candidatus Melainabacteria bacterium]|nr:hypothetical protein [Candidatus Melainabacteria bacterium]
MLYELCRALVQKIFQDKIILGLIIVLVLGFFIGGLSSRNEPAVANKAVRSDDQAPSVEAKEPKVEPSLAADFVRWWLNGAMDFAPATAQESHQLAFAWMTPDAQSAFQTYFWTPETASAVANGQLVASFHPTSVLSEAINPDGSVVVGVAGTLVVDSGAQPVLHQMTADFLVVRNQDGLRVAGINNRLVPQPGSSIY